MSAHGAATATLPIPHFTWQLLRVLVRARGKPLSGRELRHVPNRRTKDGTFLDELVSAGLLERVSVAPPPDRALPSQRQPPVQFRTLYRLTEKGKHAAEYGECERAVPTKVPENGRKSPSKNKGKARGRP